MSSSIVCQGLQSCLQPCLKLTRPDSSFSRTSGRTSNLGISHSDIIDMNPSHENNGSESCKKSHATSWSFLDAVHVAKEDHLSNNVHPFVKRSSSTLCAQNLDMCTENLGCETGSNASHVSDDIALLSLEFGSDPSKPSSKESKLNVPKKLKHRSSFPPPLTSITNLGGVQVRPHREDGRLILRAVSVGSRSPCFHAERVHGRLRLRFTNSFSQESDDKLSKKEINESSYNEAETEEDTGGEPNDLGETDETSSWNTEEWKENSCAVES